MATVNIPSYHDDPNYRYKMPKIRAKIEGRGNGIKTNIMNMGDIARALKRPPDYPTRFFGAELGSQSKFESAEGKAIVNGVHTETDLQVVLDKFVDKFVLCPNCRLPEVDLQVAKGRVKGKCNACGFHGDMDNAHKVGTYIIKNPPDGGDSTMGKKVKKSKEDRQRERAERGTSKKCSEDDEDDEQREASATTTAEGAAVPAKEKKEKKDKKKDKEKDKDGHKKDKKEKKKEKEKDEDKERRRAEKKAAKKAGKSGAAGHGSDSDEDDDEKKEALDYDSEEIEAVIARLEQFVHSQGEPPTSQSFKQEVRLLQVAQDFSSTLRFYVTLCALLKDSCDADSFKSNLHYLHAVTDRSITGDQILESFEQFLSRKAPGSWSNYPIICNALYNADLVEEESFMERYVQKTPEEAGPAYQEAKQRAASFLTWLAAAESASDDSDDDEDDD